MGHPLDTIKSRSKAIKIYFFCTAIYTTDGRDGEIGRRSGLKIRRSERTVGVRFPFPAPTEGDQRVHLPV